MKKSNKILLNEILKLENLDNVKVRFNLMFDGNWDPIDLYKNADFDTTSSEIKIRNTPPVRTTGRANVIDHTLSEGTFPVFDQNDNLLSEITIRGKLFIGLKSLAAKNPDKDICLIFKNEHFIFKA